MTTELRRSLLIPALLSTFAIVAACTSGGASPSVAAPSVAASPSAEASESAEPSESAEASESASAAPAGAVSLALADSDLGQIIVDGEGKTLYMFQPDEAGTPTCYDECAENWPPVLADDPASVTVGEGLDATKLSVVPRTDGGSQLKYGTWTLYYFANDAAPGDTNGQGLQDVWWVIGANGEPIKS